MRSRLTVLAAAIALTAGCDKKEEPKAAPSPTAPAAPPRPETLPNGEPASVSVKHVLVSFQGSQGPKTNRTREEAERLAYEILARAKAGEEIENLMREFSDDPGSKGGNAYDLCNEGVTPRGRDESPRSGMVKGFGDVCFRLAVNEVGFAPYDSATTPHGFHIIKRVK